MDVRLCSKFAFDVTQQTFVFVKTYWRRLQCNIFLSSKTSWRRIKDVLGRRIANTSWRRLEDMIARRLASTSWRRLEDVLGRRIATTSWRRLEGVLKRSWKMKSVTLKTSSRRLQDVFKTSWKTRNVCCEVYSSIFQPLLFYVLVQGPTSWCWRTVFITVWHHLTMVAVAQEM